LRASTIPPQIFRLRPVRNELAVPSFSNQIARCAAWNLRERIVMKTLIASVMALSLIAATANAAVIGVQVGPVGIGIGQYHWHGHYYHHRHWERDHWRYW
jgi:hypothetical protein